MIFWIAVIAAVIVVLMLAICQVSDDHDDAEQEAWLREYERIRKEDQQWQKRVNEMRDQRSRESKKRQEENAEKRSGKQPPL